MDGTRRARRITIERYITGKMKVPNKINQMVQITPITAPATMASWSARILPFLLKNKKIEMHISGDISAHRIPVVAYINVETTKINNTKTVFLSSTPIAIANGIRTPTKTEVM
jgi:hypothetical protein